MKRLVIAIIFFTTSLLCQQNKEWKIFNTYNSPLPTNLFHCLDVDKFNNVWIGTDSGLVKKVGDLWTIFNQNNSDIPINRVFVIQDDKDGILWLHGQETYTNKGLIKYDGQDWTVFDTSNSQIPSNSVQSIAIDSLNNKWLLPVEETNTFLTKFDGASVWENYPGYYFYAFYTDKVAYDEDSNIWTATEYFLANFNGSGYSFFNSPQPMGHYITDIKIDHTGNIWIAGGEAGWGGLTKFDGSEFTYFDTIKAVSLAVDFQDNLWIGTTQMDFGDNGKLIKYDGVAWTYYTVENSLLPKNNKVHRIRIDSYDNLWLALVPDGDDSLSGGLVEFREGGIITSDIIEINHPKEFFLSQNYPNPFNPVTKIKYQIPSVGTRDHVSVQLKVYDLLGREIATLVNEEKPAGEYEVKFDGSNLPSGIYFYQLKAEKYIQTKKMILLK